MARHGVVAPERSVNGSAVRGPRVAPPKGRKRRPALAVILLAAAAGGALLAVTLYAQAGAQDEVLALTRDVAPGQTITDGDLTKVKVSADLSLRPVPAKAQANVVGRTAKSSLGAGTLLSDSQLGERPAPRPGEAVVGLALKPGRYPSGLRVGDKVIVVVATAASDAANPRLGSSLSEARVVAVRAVEGGAGGSASAMVSVVVPDQVGPSVAGAAAADRVSLILVPAA